MAGSREGALKLHLVHGVKNHFITLTASEADEGTELAVRHLTAAAQNVTGIPQERQKLIFKGKSLTQGGDLNKSLSSLGLRQGSKVMVLGSKEDAESKSNPITRSPLPTQPPQQTKHTGQTDRTQLDSVERRLSKEETTVSAFLQQGQQLQDQGSADIVQLEQVRKGLLASTERLMRLLESLDTLRFDPSDTDGRAKRKALVNRIQQHMDHCEETLTHVKRRLADMK
ncbi:BAG family molecular chaperone regulator 1-like [Babylonia areolata]|uniref:BAG family molecular chaperone regulator 1-like n=1 Tax=Babylonia areolata TaxID=304850 RepID=UPI003FD163E4